MGKAQYHVSFVKCQNNEKYGNVLWGENENESDILYKLSKVTEREISYFKIKRYRTVLKQLEMKIYQIALNIKYI